MSGATSLDHVGIAGADLGRLAAAYQRLGFQLTPLARHSGTRTPDGPVVPFGTGNRCIMLREGYLELIAVVDPTAFDNLVGAALARYAGIHIIALGIADERAELERLRRAGLDLPGVAYLERPVDDADPHGKRARFARLPLPDAPEGRLQLIRHLTPDAIWQERFLAHPNHAVGLDSVILAVERPAESAERFSRLAGHPVEADSGGGLAIKLPRGTVRLSSARDLDAVLPGVVVPTTPFVAGIGVRTDDGNRAIRGVVSSGPISHRVLGADVLIEPGEAGGAAILFKA